MASSTSPSSLSPSHLHLHLHLRSHRNHLRFPFVLPIATLPSRVRSPPLKAYRKSPNYPPDAVVVVPDPRPWIGGANDEDGDDDDDDDEEEEEEDDRSLDLLARFIENVFRKISRRARKAVRSVLPSSFSTKLVRFTVNGVLILALLWILKAFLEVVCTLGSMVFLGILLVRGVWSGISYIREQQYYNYINRMDNNNSAWNGAQPAT